MAQTARPASAKATSPKKATAKKAVAKRAAKKGTGGSRGAPTVKSGDTCFVIMPFGSFFDAYYSEIYKPAIESLGLSSKRADDLFRPSAIVHDIWKYINDCRALVADLTGKNPNVFYELGLAHAARKPAVLVSQSMDDVPFDLRQLRVIVYDVRNPSWATRLLEDVASALRETFEAPEEYVLPPFLHSSVDLEESAVEDHDPLSDMQRRLEGLQRQVNSLVNSQPRQTLISATPVGSLGSTGTLRVGGDGMLVSGGDLSSPLGGAAITTPRILVQDPPVPDSR